jgi:hypothetical protein
MYAGGILVFAGGGIFQEAARMEMNKLTDTAVQKTKPREKRLHDERWMSDGAGSTCWSPSQAESFGDGATNSSEKRS